MNNALLLLGSFFLLLFLNMPIAWSLGGAVMIYILVSGFLPMDFLATIMFTGTDSFPLLAVPLFILAGALMQGGGIASRLIDFVDSLVGHTRGGLAMASILGCMFFGAISGSATATVITIGTVMLPAMLERGYDKGFSYALIATSGCLGVLIPPSIPMMIYGVATGASIASLFMGGMGVGILCGLFLMAYAYYVCRRRGYKGNGLKFSFKHVFEEFKSSIGALLIPIIILGGIYSGIFTPTEAAVVAVFYAVIAGFFLYKELTMKKLIESLTESASTTGMLMVIVATAIALSKAMAFEQLPVKVSAMITSFTDSPVVVLLIINFVLLITCMIMDTTPAIMLLAPLLLPIAVSYGIDPIHFGLMMCLNCAIGYITPPVGLNLYVAVKLGEGISFVTLIKNIVPFLIVVLILLVIITYIPDVSLFLPRLFLGYGQ